MNFNFYFITISKKLLKDNMRRIFILFSFVVCFLFLNSANALLPIGIDGGLRVGNSFSSIKNAKNEIKDDASLFVAPNIGKLQIIPQKQKV